MLSYDNNIENDTFLDSSSASLIITDNSLIINPLDIHNGQGSYANFEELPIIAVKTAQIFEELPKDASDNILDAFSKSCFSSCSLRNVSNSDFSSLIV